MVGKKSADGCKTIQSKRWGVQDVKVNAPKGYHWMKQPDGGYKLMKHTGKFVAHKGASLSANFAIQKVHNESKKPTKKS